MSGKKGAACHQWTDAERARLAEIAPGRSHTEIRAIMTDEFGDHFGGKRITAALKRYGIKTGRTGRFEKGEPAWNKGKTWGEFMSPEGQAASRRTCFKKGNIPHNALRNPLGSEREDAKDGYIYVKVAERKTDPKSAHDNWKPKHHLAYERAHGEVPDGCNIVFADRDKRNFDPANLVAVPRSLWSVISHRHMQYDDAESLRACMNVAMLDRAVYAARLDRRSCKRCGAEFEPRFANQRTCDKCLGR